MQRVSEVQIMVFTCLHTRLPWGCTAELRVNPYFFVATVKKEQTASLSFCNSTIVCMQRTRQTNVKPLAVGVGAAAGVQPIASMADVNVRIDVETTSISCWQDGEKRAKRRRRPQNTSTKIIKTTNRQPNADRRPHVGGPRNLTMAGVVSTSIRCLWSYGGSELQ